MLFNVQTRFSMTTKYAMSNIITKNPNAKSYLNVHC